MAGRAALWAWAACACACGSGGSGIIDAGPPPPITSCPIFPAPPSTPVSWWNRDIYNDALDPNSATYIASIGATTALHADYGSIYGIPYNVVDASTPRTAVTFQYASESDPGPYPIPANVWLESGSDSHALMVEVSECKLYELFAAHKQSDGSWRAGSGAIWDLRVNATRPEGWTSADAAGLPIFPGLVRYDEVVGKGVINHALRFTANVTRTAHIFPATHDAGSTSSLSAPPMGIRVRLKRSFVIPSTLPMESRVVLVALQHYGMFLADNGSDWYITGAEDPRWNDDNVTAIRMLHGSDLEVVAPEVPP